MPTSPEQPKFQMIFVGGPADGKQALISHPVSRIVVPVATDRGFGEAVYLREDCEIGSIVRYVHVTAH